MSRIREADVLNSGALHPGYGAEYASDVSKWSELLSRLRDSSISK
jgi:hypothetical protein